jgi:predicted extracellular nuclease
MFFYTVLNRPLTIQDVQYTPYLNGRTPYLGAVTPLSGIITADTAHIPLSPPTAGSTSSWYMQSTNQPWSGIWLTPADTTTQKQMAALRNGDSVMVTGTVQEQFDVTRLGNITGVQKLTSGNPEPAPAVRTTGGFNVGNGSPTAESYEGMVVRFNNVTVTDINPTFSDPNEYALSDGSGAVVVQKNPLNKYSNIPADTAFGKTILHVGNKFTFVTGIIHYSFNQYKFVPRTDADFGTLTGVSLPGDGVLPITYAMSQNYPNPFNPSTVIEFALPKESYVTLTVYNTLGELVTTLVDGVRSAGYYREEFNASHIPSGLYFYRLNVSSLEKTFVKKMLLLK